MKSLTAFFVFGLMAQAAKKPDVVITLDAPVPEVARSMKVSERQISTINLHMFRETWIVFPESEKILQSSSGDKDNFTMEFADAGHHIIEIKPAVEGRETNLHVLTTKANYSFLLREISKRRDGSKVDLKVFVGRDGAEEEKQQESAVADLQKRIDTMTASNRLMKQTATEAVDEANAAKRIAIEKAEKQVEAFKRDYPASQRCRYEFPHNKAPFEVSAICSDGANTFIFSDSIGLASVYAETAEGISLVRVHYARGQTNDEGVYILSGIVTKGYMQIGKKHRMHFQVVPKTLQASR